VFWINADPRFKTDMVKDKDLVLGDLEAEMIESSSLDELVPVHVVDSSDEQPSSSSATEPPAKK